MAVKPIHHLSEDTLKALSAGKLSERAAVAVSAHLDECAECRAKASSLSEDTLLGRLRAVESDSATGTPVPDTLGPLPAGVQAANAGQAFQPDVNNQIFSELPKLPEYEVQRELGQGGMGVVYLAKNKLMDRLEVLKVVKPALLEIPGARDRFLREIRMAAKLSHGNIVKAHSAIQTGELLLFAMEYVDGEDLAKTVKSRGPLAVTMACNYAQQVAQGLQHALEKGMVHRDIKPHNLILARDGRKHIVKILDFGLAKARREEEGSDSDLTGSGSGIMGTPDYIAPEQMKNASKADIRADIYSLGCTLYYLLTGKPPFEGKSLFELLQAHLGKGAVPLNKVRPDVPAKLAAVVAKMMAKAPTDRYQTPLEVVQALAPFGQVQVRKKGLVDKAGNGIGAGATTLWHAVCWPFGFLRHLFTGRALAILAALLIMAGLSASLYYVGMIRGRAAKKGPALFDNLKERTQEAQ